MIPKFDEALINARVEKIRPVVRFQQARCKNLKKGTDVLCWVEFNKMNPMNPAWSFLQQPKIIGLAERLTPLGHIVTYHNCSPDLFRPTLAEVLMQVPEVFVDKAIAFEVVEESISHRNQIPRVGSSDLTWAVTILYKEEK